MAVDSGAPRKQVPVRKPQRVGPADSSFFARTWRPTQSLRARRRRRQSSASVRRAESPATDLRPRVDDGGDCGGGDRRPVRDRGDPSRRSRTSTPAQVPCSTDDRRRVLGRKRRLAVRVVTRLDDRRTTRRGLQRKCLSLRQERLFAWKRVGVVPSLEWSSHISYQVRSRTTRSSSIQRSVRLS